MFSRRSSASGLLVAPLAAVPPSDPADLTARDAIALMRERKLTGLELTQACLRRIEKLNPQLNAMIKFLGDQALGRAKALRPTSLADEPLHGIPIRPERPI
jgi:Asp-tRNA(Asn)/Glu-tRNA(Gln) amidotransferase A subunit family amidase